MIDPWHHADPFMLTAHAYVKPPWTQGTCTVPTIPTMPEIGTTYRSNPRPAHERGSAGFWAWRAASGKAA